jgi:DNA-binding protein HU-beta
MNKTEFISALAQEAEISKAESGRFLQSFIDLVTSTLENGEDIKLIKFGSFKVVQVSEKEVKNPQTGAKIRVPASKKPKFTPGKEFKEAVNKI